MSKPIIPGGYILLSRKLLESGIMEKPPLYFKVWAWILLNAQHKDYGNLKKGQLFTTIPQIQEAMAYKVGFRKEKPSKKQIRGILNWLRFPCEQPCEQSTMEPMIEITKVTHGILITVVKYEHYQDPRNYEGHNEGHNEESMKGTRRARQGHNINKNDKNDNNLNNNIGEVGNVDFAQEGNHIGGIITHYQNQIGIMGPADEQRILDFVDLGMDAALIMKGISMAAEKKEKDKRTSRYIAGILRNWYNAGILSLADLKRDERKSPKEDESLSEEYRRMMEENLKAKIEMDVRNRRRKGGEGSK